MNKESNWCVFLEPGWVKVAMSPFWRYGPTHIKNTYSIPNLLSGHPELKIVGQKLI